MADEQKRNNPNFGELCVTGEGRLLYPWVIEGGNPDPKYGQGKYMVTAIFEKSKCDGKEGDPLLSIKTECTKVARRCFPKVELKDIMMPWKDGDAKKQAHMHGNWVIKATCKKTQPGCFAQGKVKLDPKEIYSGVYGKLSVTPLAYETTAQVVVVEKGQRVTKTETQYGVTLILKNVLSFQRGARVGMDEPGSEFGGESSGEGGEFN